MLQVKYGAVIGWKNPITWKLRLGTHKNASFLANHGAVFYPNHQITKFRQMTVVDPSQYYVPTWAPRLETPNPKLLIPNPGTL
jgi:hypothetical protein